jgi:tetratricopeptide (TPR) repeat protein
MLGREPWPLESRVELEVLGDSDLPTEAVGLGELARELVASSDPAFGLEMRGLVLAKLALSALDRSAEPGADALRPALRETLARAYYRVGRFDEALRELELAVDESEGAGKATLLQCLTDMREMIATWRDEGGLKDASPWRTRLELLELGFADATDVVMWLRSKD